MPRPHHAAWPEAADAGTVLVISGDNLDVTESGVDHAPSATSGTLVAGIVPAKLAISDKGRSVSTMATIICSTIPSASW